MLGRLGLVHRLQQLSAVVHQPPGAVGSSDGIGHLQLHNVNINRIRKFYTNLNLTDIRKLRQNSSGRPGLSKCQQILPFFDSRGSKNGLRRIFFIARDVYILHL